MTHGHVRPFDRGCGCCNRCFPAGPATVCKRVECWRSSRRTYADSEIPRVPGGTFQHQRPPPNTAAEAGLGPRCQCGSPQWSASDPVQSQQE
ncbi:hypothetical protein STRTUCAR8_08087 [Streptomyces turgidiscabies Car8]|uniref:Uncharacterized protein n=1 Tax=Streptomyces turgidiscabies (strain Car8) TaxID=698760 RepID=L7FIC7_STRT8|nr:hypothetical protein STRTUCAR8_08087 [Streptomyces turgidiscabies Car8]